MKIVDGKTSWLTDNDGEKIPVTGEDGVTPLLKVDSNGYWIVSYDNGVTYSTLFDNNGNPIKASAENGNSFFLSIEITEDSIILILLDGSEIIIPLGDVPPLKAIDLGLSVKWASFNMGATTETESGGLYFWGDPDNIGDHNYKAPNLDIISGTAYDIARAKWGSTWRMPTRGEQNELIFYCTWRRVTINGVKGMRLTGPNGNSIFLPPTGYQFLNSEILEEDDGYYMTGEILEDNFY